ncbi:MAG: trypsin-like peptidase domain-containing protein [Deltaproteobacteria bacterium]|nr:trypsin-like peptidase domain-containing protein [Deltaproteobacteria bacterium]
MRRGDARRWLTDEAAARTALATLLLATIALPGCRRKAAPAPVTAPPPATVKILHPGAPGSFVRLVGQARASILHLRSAVPVKSGPADWFPPESPDHATVAGEWTERQQRALGSAFLIDAEGHALTNAHLVGEQAELLAELPDRPELKVLKAKVLGRDAKTDLALLKLELPAGLRVAPLRLGNSDDLQVGEWLVAVGNPFGAGPVATAGVLSARERRDVPTGEQGYWGFLQLDARIHPGNSGGPVLNTVGEVVGLASAVRPGSEGVGLALPINVAKKIVPMLRREGRVVRAWVGIYIERVTTAHAERAGLKEPRGAFVSSVVPQGPGERAGLRPGDVVVAFDQQEIREANDLPAFAATAGVGRAVAIRVLRAGKTLDFTLQTERMPQ